MRVLYFVCPLYFSLSLSEGNTFSLLPHQGSETLRNNKKKQITVYFRFVTIALCQNSYLCIYILHGPVRNAFDAGSIYYKGKWEEAGPWKSRLFRALLNGMESIDECHLVAKKVAQGHRIHGCIGGFMYRSPQVVSGPIAPLL